MRLARLTLEEYIGQMDHRYVGNSRYIIIGEITANGIDVDCYWIADTKVKDRDGLYSTFVAFKKDVIAEINNGNINGYIVRHFGVTDRIVPKDEFHENLELDRYTVANLNIPLKIYTIKGKPICVKFRHALNGEIFYKQNITEQELDIHTMFNVSLDKKEVIGIKDKKFKRVCDLNSKWNDYIDNIIDRDYTGKDELKLEILAVLGYKDNGGIAVTRGYNRKTEYRAEPKKVGYILRNISNKEIQLGGLRVVSGQNFICNLDKLSINELLSMHLQNGSVIFKTIKNGYKPYIRLNKGISVAKIQIGAQDESGKWFIKPEFRVPMLNGIE